MSQPPSPTLHRYQTAPAALQTVPNHLETPRQLASLMLPIDRPAKRHEVVCLGPSPERSERSERGPADVATDPLDDGCCCCCGGGGGKPRSRQVQRTTSSSAAPSAAPHNVDVRISECEKLPATRASPSVTGRMRSPFVDGLSPYFTRGAPARLVRSMTSVTRRAGDGGSAKLPKAKCEHSGGSNAEPSVHFSVHA